MSDDKTEKKRRGKAVKEKRGEAATFEPGTGAPPREFDPETIVKKLHLWWEDEGGDTYIVGSQPKVVPGGSVVEGELFEERPSVWSSWPKGSVEDLLRSEWVRQKAREGEPLGEMAKVLLYVKQHRRLECSLKSIPGYRSGIYDLQGERVLVKTSPRFMEFREGEWPTVRALIEGKLDLLDDEGHGITQADYFHSWMKKAVESLYTGGPGNFQSGQCLVFAGPGDVGKSRIQHQVVTPLLGGRSADPSAYLFGKSDFNSEIFSAEHVLMEEMEQTSSKNVDRLLFGERVKKLVTADWQRLHAKRKDAQMVEPFFRCTITINNDPDKMRLLFLLTPDMRDKVMLFLVSDTPLPMPTTTLPERAAFREQIAKELPAYGYWLMNEYQVPAGMALGRFGVRSWHHPTLAMELFDDTPAAELLQIIDAAEFKSGGENGSGKAYKLWDLVSHADAEKDEWEGTALELERVLLGEGGFACSVAREAKKLFLHNKGDRLLARLKEDQGERVAHHRTKMERRWIVRKAV